MPVPPFNAIERFSYLFPQWANGIPFTYQDGQTNAKLLESLVRFIDQTLVTGTNDAINELANAWNVSTDALIELVVSNSIELQEPVLEEIIGNPESNTQQIIIALINAQSYTKAQVDGFIAGRASDAELAAEVTARTNADTTLTNNLATLTGNTYTKSQVDGFIDGRASDAELSAEVTARGTADTTLSGRITPLEALVTGSARLTEGYLDARYVNELPAGHMVTIGSSNAVPATLWVAGVATDLGLANHNYSVSGGSFSGAGSGRFENQLAAAIADNSFLKANVRVVLIADASNDIRATADIADEAQNLFYTARLNYPNARIIVLPAVWNLYADNIIPGRQASVTRRYYEMTGPAAMYGVELINYSWTWTFDSTAYIDTVHLTTAGYDLVRGNVAKYIKLGGDTDRPLGWKMGIASVNVPADYMYLRTQRVGNVGFISESFMANDLGVDTAIATMQAGANPLRELIFECYQTTNRNATGTLVLYPSGLLRTWGALDGGATAEVWTVNASYAVF